MTVNAVATATWHPRTGSERELVRSQLERILSDGRFAASKRYPQLLRYIVEETLADNEENLKERTIGVEVFHRSPDYDTNLDPVVRLCAAEVRKRLALYYQFPAHGGELRIDLNPGSYVPVFSQPSSEASSIIVDTLPAEVVFKPEQIIPPPKDRKISGRAWFMVSGAIIVALVILGARYWSGQEKQKITSNTEKQKSDLEKVWSPLLTSKRPILFCVGGTELLLSPPGSPLTELQSGADDESSLQALKDKNDFVPFSDVQILSRFVSLVGAQGHAFTVQNSRTTVPSQLREGPVVLIGALNNDWTLNRTSSLRFHLEGPEGPSRVYWIADKLHPELRRWQVSTLAPRRNVITDYAIAARFNDEATGQALLVAAGIAGSGTRAAGEFLSDEADLKQLADGSGVDWSRSNFEIVISSQVVNGMQGKPKVEAIEFW